MWGSERIENGRKYYPDEVMMIVMAKFQLRPIRFEIEFLIAICSPAALPFMPTALPSQLLASFGSKSLRGGWKEEIDGNLLRLRRRQIARYARRQLILPKAQMPFRAPTMFVYCKVFVFLNSCIPL